MSLSILSFKLHISFEVKKKNIHYYLLLTERKYLEGRSPREGGREFPEEERRQMVTGFNLATKRQGGVFAECLFTEQQGLCQASYLSPWLIGWYIPILQTNKLNA